MFNYPMHFFEGSSFGHDIIRPHTSRFVTKALMCDRGVRSAISAVSTELQRLLTSGTCITFAYSISTYGYEDAFSFLKLNWHICTWRCVYRSIPCLVMELHQGNFIVYWKWKEASNPFSMCYIICPSCKWWLRLSTSFLVQFFYFETIDMTNMITPLAIVVLPKVHDIL